MSKYLVGHTIKEMKIADDKKAILFVTDKENVIAKMDGDCCSDTWCEHIEMVSLPATVIDVEDIDMPNLGNPDEYEVVAYYGCKITTDKGHIIIDYRNSSNGYYGGNISFPDDSYFYGGVYGQNVSKEVWKDIAAAEQSVHPTCAICGDTGVAGPTWSHPEGEACECTRG